MNTIRETLGCLLPLVVVFVVGFVAVGGITPTAVLAGPVFAAAFESLGMLPEPWGFVVFLGLVGGAVFVASFGLGMAE